MVEWKSSKLCNSKADCIIALGSRFDDRTTGNVDKYAPNTFKAYYDEEKYGGIVHVNIEQSEIGKVVESHNNFNIDCKDFLKEALKYAKYNPRTDWINEIKDLKNNYKFKYNVHESKLWRMYFITCII